MYSQYVSGELSPPMMAQLDAIRTACLIDPNAYTRASVAKARQEQKQRREGGGNDDDSGINQNDRNMFSELRDDFYGKFKNGFLTPKSGALRRIVGPIRH